MRPTAERVNTAFYVSETLFDQLLKVAIATDQGSVYLMRAAIDATVNLKGVTPPPPGPVMLRMRLSPAHNDRIEALAASAQMTKSEALRALCQSIVDTHRGLL